MEFWKIIIITLAIALAIFLMILIISIINKKRSNESAAEKMIAKLLPNVNCGACGNEYCKWFAKDVAEGKAKVAQCPLISYENRAKIENEFEKEAKADTKKIAYVKCKGGKNCPDRYVYNGCQSCGSQNRLHSGAKTCEYACLGCGDCVKTCPFSAISINENGVAFIDTELCVGCGNCVLSCPNNLIKLIPYAQRVVPVCNNLNTTPGECAGCKVGCIHCGHCVEVCPTGAISLESGVPVVDENKCIHCYKCVRVCPNHLISRI